MSPHEHDATETSPSPAASQRDYGHGRGGGENHGGALRIFLGILLLLVIGGAGYYLFNMHPAEKTGAGGGGGKLGKGKNSGPVPVTVATATVEDVPIEIRSIGNVLSYSVVNVIPQVGGQLKKVTFTQGQFVKKGDVLFQIDPRPFQAAYDQAMGNVARDKAQVESARANMAKDQAQVGLLIADMNKDIASSKYADAESARYGALVSQGAVSHEQSDQMNTNAATAQSQIDADKKAVENERDVVRADKAAIDTAIGTLKADQAAADSAKLQLGFTKIYSPIDGCTSSLNVYEGNVVQANQATALVTIDQIQPIYIQFTLPEQHLDHIRRAIANHTLKVNAMIEGKKADVVEGSVSFIQNTVDTTSGTVTMRATFANTSTSLYPGQFVDVVVSMPANGSTVVIPATALQTSQQGNSVYIVRPGDTVDFVTVDVARTVNNTAAITSGLKEGDVVVTDGQLQLTPGAKVSVQQGVASPSGNAGAPPSESSAVGN